MTVEKVTPRPPPGTRRRKVPPDLLGATDVAAVQPVARLLQREGMVLSFAHGDRAYLRVVVALQPDIVLLDPRLPRSLLSLLRTHPLAKSAHIGWTEALGGSSARGRRLTGAEIRERNARG